MFSQRKTIKELRERASIVNIVSRYLSSIKKKGKDFVALCPFHYEKTPSFYVSEEKQIFHCFGCGKGGDVFKFVAEIENIDFAQALKRVAEYSNFILNEITPDQSSKRSDEKKRISRLYTIMQDAAHFYTSELTRDLKNVGECSKYLNKRGLKQEQITQLQEIFQIGFAPDGWDNLGLALAPKGISAEEMIRAGLSSTNQNNQRFDRFRQRLIFPIQDEQGRIVAFGGRVIDGDKSPKYLNSPESEVFHKGKLLYGLYQGKEEIRKNKRVFIVEGYLDVLGSFMAGLKNCVAPLGTALTQDQLRLLSRYTKEAVLVFDGDNAGKNAALRVAELARNFSLDFKIILLAQGEDPFDFFLKKDLVDFFSMAEKADNLHEFEIKHFLKDIGGKEGLNLALIATREFESAISRETSVNLISKLLSINPFAIKEELAKLDITGNRRFIQPAEQTGDQLKKESIYAYLTAEERNLSKIMHSLLLLAILFPETLDNLIMDFSLDSFKTSEDRELFMKLTESHIEGETIDPGSLNDLDLDQNSINRINGELMQDALKGNEKPEVLYTRLSLQARIYLTDEKINNIKNKIPGQDQITNSGIVQTAFMDLAILQHDRDRMVERLHNL